SPLFSRSHPSTDSSSNTLWRELPLRIGTDGKSIEPGEPAPNHWLPPTDARRVTFTWTPSVLVNTKAIFSYCRRYWVIATSRLLVSVMAWAFTRITDSHISPTWVTPPMTFAPDGKLPDSVTWPSCRLARS